MTRLFVYPYGVPLASNTETHLGGNEGGRVAAPTPIRPLFSSPSGARQRWSRAREQATTRPNRLPKRKQARRRRQTNDGRTTAIEGEKERERAEEQTPKLPLQANGTKQRANEKTP